MEYSERPWGTYQVLLDDANCKVKKIVVNPGQSLSYQYHHKRSEDWLFITGTGVMTLDDKEFSISSGEKIHIPATSKHSVRNDGTSDLTFIEIQTGEYFGEDDIVRLSDKYGRC